MPEAKVIVVAGQKGGPGKTTTAMNLAATLSQVGGNVLVVDIDPQGSAVGWAETAADRLPFDFTSSDDPELLSQLGSLSYDYVVVDTPGSLVERDKNQALIPSADLVVVPTRADPLGMEPLARTVHRVIKPAGVPFRVLLNEVKASRGKAWPWATRRTLQAAGLPCFTTHITDYDSLTLAPGTGDVVTQLTDKMGIRSARAYRGVVDEIHAILDVTPGGTK